MVETNPSNAGGAVAQPRKPGSGLSIASLICSVLGFCLPGVGLLGLLLGVVALLKKSGGRGLAIAGTVVGGLTIPFTLLQLAIIVPSLLAARGAASEAAASATCMVYVSAQGMHRVQQGAYAGDLAALAKTGAIDQSLAAASGPAGTPKFGYIFQECRTVGGSPVDPKTDFALCATPARYGSAGRRTFLVRSDGIVWAKDLGRSELLADCPADPAAEGWSSGR